MKNLLLGSVAICSLFLLPGATYINDFKEINETYVVKSGDSLWSIASVYVDKNTYAQGGSIKEYIFNIVHEWNYELFKNRTSDQLYPGEEIRLYYWTKSK